MRQITSSPSRKFYVKVKGNLLTLLVVLEKSGDYTLAGKGWRILSEVEQSVWFPEKLEERSRVQTDNLGEPRKFSRVRDPWKPWDSKKCLGRGGPLWQRAPYHVATLWFRIYSGISVFWDPLLDLRRDLKRVVLENEQRVPKSARNPTAVKGFQGRRKILSDEIISWKI